MPRPLTAQEREAFLAEPHTAVLSVGRDGGRPPHAAPTWYAYEPGGNVTFFTSTEGRKARKVEFIRRAGVVSLTVQHGEHPYKYVTVEGTVVQIDQPPSAEQVIAIARRYIPEEAAHGFAAAELGRPDSEIILFTVRPDRWLTFDFGADAGSR